MAKSRLTTLARRGGSALLLSAGRAFVLETVRKSGDSELKTGVKVNMSENPRCLGKPAHLWRCECLRLGSCGSGPSSSTGMLCHLGSP